MACDMFPSPIVSFVIVCLLFVCFNYALCHNTSVIYVYMLRHTDILNAEGLICYSAPLL